MTNLDTILGGFQEIVDFILRYAVMLAAQGPDRRVAQALQEVFASMARLKHKTLCRHLIDEAPVAAGKRDHCNPPTNGGVIRSYEAFD